MHARGSTTLVRANSRDRVRLSTRRSCTQIFDLVRSRTIFSQTYFYRGHEQDPRRTRTVPSNSTGKRGTWTFFSDSPARIAILRNCLFFAKTIFAETTKFHVGYVVATSIPSKRISTMFPAPLKNIGDPFTL